MMNETMLTSGQPTVNGGKRATCLAFFIAGFALACWAPLVPFALIRLHADADLLGRILLCLGLGAVLGMPLASGACGQLGIRAVIVTSALALVVTLPLLTILATPAALSLCLLVFGAAIGAIDMAANLHGMEVQKIAKMPLMSGFHGMFSLGGLIGASGMAGMVALGVAPQTASLLACGAVLACGACAFSGFLGNQAHDRQPMVVAPRGNVIVLGILLFMTFLTEGAMLDWSAVLLAQYKHVAIPHAGAGYAAFAVSMVASRLLGDVLVSRYGERAMLVSGFVMTGVGIGLFANSTSYAIVMLSTVVSGLAVGNLVPALFHLAGRQSVMPTSHAVAAITMIGYIGGLAGPGLIGSVARWTDLVTAFNVVALGIAAMAMLVPGVLACSPVASSKTTGEPLANWSR